VKEKPSVGSQFFGAFPSDRIPKAKKGVNVYYVFIHSSNFCELYQRNPGNVLKLLRVRVLKVLFLRIRMAYRNVKDYRLHGNKYSPN